MCAPTSFDGDPLDPRRRPKALLSFACKLDRKAGTYRNLLSSNMLGLHRASRFVRDLFDWKDISSLVRDLRLRTGGFRSIKKEWEGGRRQVVIATGTGHKQGWLNKRRAGRRGSSSLLAGERESYAAVE
jgi:hypothetical protein